MITIGLDLILNKTAVEHDGDVFSRLDPLCAAISSAVLNEASERETDFEIMSLRKHSGCSGGRRPLVVADVQDHLADRSPLREHVERLRGIFESERRTDERVDLVCGPQVL